MGKIQPFKALGGVLKTAAPIAGLIPGVGPMWAGLGGALGGLLDPAKSGGGKSGYGTAAQMALIRPLMDLLNDPGRAVADYRNSASFDANRLGNAIGGLSAETSGNPNALNAVRLGMQNQATSAGNKFAYDAFSPEGRAKTSASILGLLQGVNQQHLQQKQIGLEYQQPTFLESVVNAGTSSLPYILQLLERQRKTPTTVATSNVNTQGFGSLSQPMQWNLPQIGGLS